tara:strand:- start:2762 stop:3253 length:492 start_codon:yes stop_codon:yes gene_type:complete
MPLIIGTLQSELISIFEKGPSGNPAPQLVGIKVGQAYQNYCSTIINAGGGSFTAMPGATILGNEIGNILSTTSPAGALTGQKMAKAFDSCLSTLMSVFQTTIITAPGLGSLIPEMIDLFSTPNPSATLFANKLARALNTFTSSAIITGVIPGTPPVPFTGPPS